MVYSTKSISWGPSTKSILLYFLYQWMSWINFSTKFSKGLQNCLTLLWTWWQTSPSRSNRCWALSRNNFLSPFFIAHVFYSTTKIGNQLIKSHAVSAEAVANTFYQGLRVHLYQTNWFLMYNWITNLHVEVAYCDTKYILFIVRCTFVYIKNKGMFCHRFTYLFANINWEIIFELISSSSLVHF